MLLSSISSSGSPTTRPSLLSRMCNAAARGTSWVVTVPGTTSTYASIIMQIGPAHTSMFCGHWSASVMPPVLPPITRITSSRAPLLTRSATTVTTPTQSAGGLFAGVHVYHGPYPWRVLALDLPPLQQAGRRLLCGPWLSGAQRGVLSPPRRLLPRQPVHHRDGVCSGCGVAWCPHRCASPRCCASQPAAPPHGRRRECLGRPPLGSVARVVILSCYSEPSRLPRVWFCRCPWRDFLNKRNSLSTRPHFSGLVVSPLPAPCIVGLGFTAALSSPHVSSGATPLRTVSFKQKRHSMTAVRTGRERAAALCREKCSGVFFGIGSSVICAAQSTRASEMRLRIVSPAGRWTRKQTWTITTR
jgi:hypothetical protein